MASREIPRTGRFACCRASSKKCRASSGMSSVRSRNGVRWISKPFSRCSRSSRNAPRCTPARRSRLVADTTRTSTRESLSAPGRRYVPYSIERRMRAWFSRLRSPTSSRKIVPPWASASSPGDDRSAPVNAPRSYPNIKLSNSSCGIAAQFTTTNGPRRRADCWCSSRATSSFPVPVSPVITTLRSDFAASPMRRRTSRIGLLPPTRARLSPARARRYSLSRRSCSISSTAHSMGPSDWPSRTSRRRSSSANTPCGVCVMSARAPIAVPPTVTGVTSVNDIASLPSPSFSRCTLRNPRISRNAV